MILIGTCVLVYAACMVFGWFREVPLKAFFYWGGFIGGFALAIRLLDAGYGAFGGIAFVTCAVMGIVISGKIE